MDGGERLRQISERDFRRLCGNVWADCLIQFEGEEDSLSALEKEHSLLICVSNSLCEALHLATEPGAAARAESAAGCRQWIDGVMSRAMAEPFDYQKIINRLVREVA